MDLKWLEDFVSLARTGNVSRSAEERHVTQSAFSRRIQALETWLGVALIDRSTYPTALTAAGRQFRETAEDAVRMLYGSRAALQASARPNTHTVAVAALHTLALSFFPRWFRHIQDRTGPLSSRLLSDDFHTCIQAVAEGGYDFLLTFYHPSVPILLDPAQFPHVVAGADSLAAVHGARTTGDGLPLLSYAQNSFLGRVATFAQAGRPAAATAHTNENAMAEALKLMALEGHGLAWLPRSLVASELDQAGWSSRATPCLSKSGFTGTARTAGPRWPPCGRPPKRSRRQLCRIGIARIETELDLSDIGRTCSARRRDV